MATDHLDHLDADARRLLAVLAAAPASAGVPHCPGWDLGALTRHLGAVHRWVTTVVQTGAKAPQLPPEVEGGQLAAWLSEGVVDLQAALSASDPGAACWTLVGPGRAGFWRRRMALETAVHRWDAEHAVRAPGPIDADLAADGVAEVLEVMLPRQVHLGRTPAPTTAVRLVTTDAGGGWDLGSGTPLATVTGPAEVLLLLLWRRTTRADPRLTCAGDLAALDALLAVALTP